jgi:O-antigen ligase
MAILLDKSFHKVKDGIFMTSPYSYVNAATAAFYVSEKEDKNDIVNPDYKAIFEFCYDSLSNQKLLMSNTKRERYTEHYNFFHHHVPEICNQTIHQIGKAYYLEKSGFNESGSKQDYAQATLDIEIALKSIVPILIKNNFKKWLRLYVANLSHAFYSIFILVFIVLVFAASLVRILFTYKHSYAMLFLLSGLTLSNAMLVSFASHSIMRYLFYNFALIFLMILVIYNLIRNEQRN